MEKWSLYNINWVKDTEGDIDYINGFVEVYNDPLGYTGSYETIVQIKDFEASERMAVMMDNAQWFEDHMPFMDEHKKKEVVGITYNVVNVVGEAGDASPSTPIGVNLPNANWIRTLHGSKSVSLGNIIDAYDNAEAVASRMSLPSTTPKRAGQSPTAPSPARSTRPSTKSSATPAASSSPASQNPPAPSRNTRAPLRRTG